MQIIVSLVVGVAVGAIFTAFKLPVPAPGVIEGVVGIVGIYLGMVVFNFLKPLI